MMRVPCFVCNTKEDRDSLLCSTANGGMLWGHVDCLRSTLSKLRPDIRVLAGPNTDVVELGDLESEGWGQPRIHTWFQLRDEV